MVKYLLEKKIKKAPDSPGIYLFFDVKKELIYVGKATSLKNRVRSYWTGKKTPRPIELMLHEVVNVKWKETDSVLEAMILEANYIKKFQPKYNVSGKDDKSWNYIVITDDEFPKVLTLRAREYEELKNKNKKTLKQFKKMFGPYPGLNTKATMRLLQKLFYISTCKPGAKRACLYHEMGQCLGVCVGEISANEYKSKVIRPLTTFLGGRKKQLIRSLEVRMRKVAKAHEFEEAARLRNQIRALQRIQDIALLNKSFVEDKESQNLKFNISRIEGYDISNLGKTGIVGSMVVFDSDGPVKSQYRKFRIKTLEGQSDVGALEEMFIRRLKHDEWKYPDIFLVDGGKPQVNRVKKILKELNINIPVVGIAKGPTRKKNEFILGTKNKAVVAWIYKNTKLLIRVRDEAHRFAIAYQRKLRMRR